MGKKLIYVMNHYSEKSDQHFYHIINLLKEMANKGIEIALIIEKADDIPVIKHENITVICQKEKENYKRVIELFFILKRLLKNGYNKIFIRITLNSAIISIIAAKLFNAETYYWHSGTTYEVDSDKSLIKKIKWKLFSYSRFWFVKENINYFVTGPESMATYYSEKLKVASEKIIVLYNDIDIKRFNKTTSQEKEFIKKKLGLEMYEKVVIMVHRLSPVRKTDFYIPYVIDEEVFSNLNATLVIIGDGPERAYLEKLIKNSPANQRIKLLGSKPNNVVQEYYKAADIFINPSFTEGFPRVVIEAMACSLPVVATNAGGTIDIFGPLQREYITDKNDRATFQVKLSELLSSKKEQIKLSDENLKMVNKYSTEEVSNMYIERIFTNAKTTTHKLK